MILVIAHELLCDSTPLFTTYRRDTLSRGVKGLNLSPPDSASDQSEPETIELTLV